MKNSLFKLISMLLVLTFVISCNEEVPVLEESTDTPLLKSAQTTLKDYIVVLNDAELENELVNLTGFMKRQEAASRAASKVLKRAGITDAQIKHTYGSSIKGFAVSIPPGQVKKLGNDPSVYYLEEDRVVTMIKPESLQLNGDVSAQADTMPWGITRVNGGANYTGSNVAWVLDSGIDLDHPDLNVDVGRSWTAFSRGRDGTPEDKNGHGTHVAGTIAAKNNGSGVVGVAAGATVVAVKVLDSRGSGSYSGVIAGVDYVGANGASGDVANMSLTGPGSQALDDAVLAASTNVKFTLAAGNDTDDTNNYSPARANGANIYTISAMAEGDNWASFSNYSNPPVDFCEPGVGILSTYKDGGYATANGTSMAAPHAAGILLAGSIAQDGFVSGDPDGTADQIGVLAGGTPPPPPPNQAPVADFTYTTNQLTADFTDNSSDTDGTVVSWSWDFGNGNTSTAQNPSHTFASDGTYTVSLTVTDDDGATDSTSQNVTVNAASTGGIDLTASGYKIKGRKHVDLTWSGATTTSVEIYRDGVLIATTTNDGAYTDNIGSRGGGSYTYTVCEAGTSTCSNDATVVF